MRPSAVVLLLTASLTLAACGETAPAATPTSAVPGPAPTAMPTRAPVSGGATPSPMPVATLAGGSTPTPISTPAPLPAQTPTPTATPAQAPTARPSPTPSGNSVTLFPIADVSLYGESGNLGNGAGEHLFAGFTNQGNERRALVRFDLSSIPADATVTSVRLELTVDRTQAGPLSYGLHRVTTSWSEGVENAGDSEGRGASNPSGATWTRATLTTHWGAPGGDFETNASGSATVDALGTGVSWESAGLVADVQAWLVSPVLNLGWLVKSTASSGTRTAKRFGSKEGDPAARPTLMVEYSVP